MYLSNKEYAINQDRSKAGWSVMVCGSPECMICIAQTVAKEQECRFLAHGLARYLMALNLPLP